MGRADLEERRHLVDAAAEALADVEAEAAPPVLDKQLSDAEHAVGGGGADHDVEDGEGAEGGDSLLALEHPRRPVEVLRASSSSSSTPISIRNAGGEGRGRRPATWRREGGGRRRQRGWRGAAPAAAVLASRCTRRCPAPARLASARSPSPGAPAAAPPGVPSTTLSVGHCPQRLGTIRLKGGYATCWYMSSLEVEEDDEEESPGRRAVSEPRSARQGRGWEGSGRAPARARIP
eukprot:997405-Rhodomonas_salina.1